VSDAFVFDLVRHGSVSSIPLREKIEAGVIAAVPLSAYLGVQLARHGVGRDRGVLELVDLRARVRDLEARVSQIRDSFSRYVSPQVVDRLLKDPSQLELGGELREVTVLFADVRGYSTLSEKLDPREVVRLLNAYFAEVGAAVLEHDGMISEFEGDGILAVFGAPVALPDHALRAVRCGEEMLRRVEALNVRWRNDGTARHFDAVGLAGLGTRVGIHSGTVVAGNIGTGARIKYAVVGDAVNTAARIEALVKTLGERLLFSSDTLALLGDTVAARPCGSHAVKGRAQPVTVFTTTSPPTTTTSTTSTTATAATTATATTATTAHAAEPLDIVPR
jgi:class 3 adenylate cyclase